MTRQSDALRDRLGRYVTSAESALAHESLALLRELTPVDTGRARDGWRIVPGREGGLAVVNAEPHIVYLNLGSSSQAPAGFVETAREQAIANVQATHGKRATRAADVQIIAPGVG